jgi:D-3-phosphoglycerate dehydrogenase
MAHLHVNTPGILATINGVLAEHGVNIEGQFARDPRRGRLGPHRHRVVYPEDVVTLLRELPETIPLRLLS